MVRIRCIFIFAFFFFQGCSFPVIPPGGILVVSEGYRVAGVALADPDAATAQLVPPPARLWQWNLLPGNRASVGSGGFSSARNHLYASFGAAAGEVAGGGRQGGGEADEVEGQGQEQGDREGEGQRR
jgi:hypothetical protein